MFSLEGKTALVTGASGGIGAAIAALLHQAGAGVALTGTREDALRTLAEKLGGGRRAWALPANLSDRKEADCLVGKAEHLTGRPIDILVNNAGMTRDGLAMRMKDQDWEEVLKLDLEAPFRLSRAAVKGMLKRRSGRIINIASIVGFTGNGGQVNYAAAKAGLVGFTKSLAQETASRGVTVNVVAPGFIETAMTDALPEKIRQNLLASIPMGRMGAARDVAAAVLYLASEEAGWVTGTTLHVNGGMAML